MPSSATPSPLDQLAGSDTCTWRQDDYDDADAGVWSTDCGREFVLNEGPPSDNDMRFCCYCGRPLRELPYAPDADFSLTPDSPRQAGEEITDG